MIRTVSAQPTSAVDPISGAIMQRLVTNAAREMGLTLMRSTRSPVLFEARDFCTGIFDATGRVIEQHKYLPMHAFLLPPVVAAVITRWTFRSCARYSQNVSSLVGRPARVTCSIGVVRWPADTMRLLARL